MDLEEKMDYLVENTDGKVNEYIHSIIDAYYSLKNDFEVKKEEYENYREHSRPLTQMEESGMRDTDFY